ncbi:MAG: GIY-YIG nuclease family protein [Calditrichaceae bacterium]|nr:GIY-YIG nuclease family protein [Calditrichaceae bacterium]MBN2709359.1 GIY-YIG nuclease family protein [Calditrichaceae bacterium]
MEKKEAIRSYKETIQPMGIYVIKNKKNGKIFIGGAKNLQGKLNSHRFQLKNGLHPNKEMQKDFNALGETGFLFEILDQLKPKDNEKRDYTDDLKILEEMWLEKLQPFNEKGYNKIKTV